jgi:hypothetical protein
MEGEGEGGGEQCRRIELGVNGRGIPLVLTAKPFSGLENDITLSLTRKAFIRPLQRPRMLPFYNACVVWLFYS